MVNEDFRDVVNRANELIEEFSETLFYLIIEKAMAGQI